MPRSSIRFKPEAAASLREAIRLAQGIEVFAIGRPGADGDVCDVEVAARGNAESVPALHDRVRPGQVVIHNHPSGLLEASEADLALAARYGEDGIGVVIVDNAVERDLWVVEPHVRAEVAIDPEAVREIFEKKLPEAIEGYEARPQQVEMAVAISQQLSGAGVLVAEAGTGTGKSLAYLVPAVQWARANDRRVVISTYTRALQDQLFGADIPMARRAGLSFEAALLKGRSNYLCRRKLYAAVQDAKATSSEDLAALESIAAWARTAPDGLGSQLPVAVSSDLWERLESDRFQTLGVGCPQYERCFYYEARRRAASSHILVVNHSLLLVDLDIKSTSGGHGILPAFDRVILDEAHHLVDAATNAGTTRVSALAVRRAVAPLLPRRTHRGALDHLRKRWTGVVSPLDQAGSLSLEKLLVHAEDLCDRTQVEAPFLLESIAAELSLGLEAVTLEPSGGGRETGEEDQNPLASERRSDAAGTLPEPSLGQDGGWLAFTSDLAARLDEVTTCLATLEKASERLEVPASEVQPWLDVRRARNRAATLASNAKAMLRPDANACRWAELERFSGRKRTSDPAPSGVLCRAPIDVGIVLLHLLYEQTRASVQTSATLAVGPSFDYHLARTGLHLLSQSGDEAQPRATVVARSWPSTFDFENQAVLALPKDLPAPDEPGWDAAVGDLVVELVRVAGGGTFVLCTSFRQVDLLAERLESAFGPRLCVLRQESGGRQRLLSDFIGSGRAVLLGADTFWEGVSVKGDALRMVVIPRLPFAVPSEPVAKARHARAAAEGRDPFRACSLPDAVLRLRQGFGRLIRSASDRGAVSLLDRRLHDRWYGRSFLNALPPATRIVGPSRVVLARLSTFFRDRFPAVQSL
jgi:ATP-dependent DNA helicase DinG